MSDLIRRADAIEAVEQAIFNHDSAIMRISALPSAELPKGDLISRADVLKYPIRLDHYDEENGSREFVYGVESVIEYVESLPSADADGDDLIIKGAKGIQDGLYNIKDGKLFKYKAKGGTVRTYPIVPSADAVSREMREPTEEERASVKRYIDSISADVVSVVRCKDCRHYREVGATHYGVCYERPNVITSQKDDDYCSYGERAEQTDDTDMRSK